MMRPLVKPTSSRICHWISQPALTTAGVIYFVQMSRSLRSLLFMPGSSSEDRQGQSISHTGMGAREILIEVAGNSQDFSEGRVIKLAALIVELFPCNHPLSASQTSPSGNDLGKGV